MQFGHGFAGKADSSRAESIRTGVATVPRLLYHCRMFPDGTSRMRLFALALWLAVEAVSGVELRAAKSRLTLAVLPLHNGTTATEEDHWRFTAQLLLSDALSEAKALQVRPTQATVLAREQLKYDLSTPLDETKVREIGGLVEARRVVWGSYQHNGPKWQISVRVLNVAAGNASRVLQAEGPDWFAARDGVCRQILQELGVNPTATNGENERDLDRFTSGPGGFQPGARDEPGEQALGSNRSTAAKDAGGRFGVFQGAPRSGVGSGKSGQIRRSHSLHAADHRAAPGPFGRALAPGPDLSLAAFRVAGRGGIRVAQKLDPDDPLPFHGLGMICHDAGKTGEALLSFSEAQRLFPNHPEIHAALARAWKARGERERSAGGIAESGAVNPAPRIRERLLGSPARI